MATPRATIYRQRADAIDPNAEGMSAEERATALRHQQALRHLADIEEWVSAEPRVAANYDYELVPKIVVKPSAPMRANARGRRVGTQYTDARR
jgi:hypothetical protein